MKTITSILLAAVMIIAAATTLLAEEAAKTVFEQPILISSAGQSADAKMVGMLARKQKLDATVSVMAKPADRDGGKPLVIVPGFSSKGLGAAGVSQTEETDRVNALIAAAKAKGIPVVTVHVGGSARRGGQSDSFCKLAADASKHMIIVAQGDEDKFFTTIAKANGVPIEVVEKIADTADPFGALFAAK